MANPKKRVPENVPGDFFVDSTCIDCDACRQIAPSVFGEAAETYARSHARSLCPTLSEPISLHWRSPGLGPGRASPFGFKGLLLVFVAAAGRVDDETGRVPIRMGVAWPRSESTSAIGRDAGTSSVPSGINEGKIRNLRWRKFSGLARKHAQKLRSKANATAAPFAAREAQNLLKLQHRGIARNAEARKARIGNRQHRWRNQMNASSGAIPRLVPDEPFPPYAYIPGRNPHPTADPAGHSFGIIPTVPPKPEPAQWQESRPYLYGIDLFNGGYYWESHVAWESLWMTYGRKGIVADFLKGLIKLAAAGVKALEGRPEGVKSHSGRAVELWRGVIQTEQDLFMGLKISELIDLAKEIYGNGWPAKPLALIPTFPN